MSSLSMRKFLVPFLAALALPLSAALAIKETKTEIRNANTNATLIIGKNPDASDSSLPTALCNSPNPPPPLSR
jgi:hypothetical protein